MLRLALESTDSPEFEFLNLKWVLQRQQLYCRVVDSQPYINRIEEPPKSGVRESKEHRRSNPRGHATLLRVASPRMNM
jgi:hypothetical protein